MNLAISSSTIYKINLDNYKNLIINIIKCWEVIAISTIKIFSLNNWRIIKITTFFYHRNCNFSVQKLQFEQFQHLVKCYFNTSKSQFKDIFYSNYKSNYKFGILKFTISTIKILILLHKFCKIASDIWMIFWPWVLSLITWWIKRHHHH